MKHNHFSLIQYEQLANNQSRVISQFFKDFHILNKSNTFQSLKNYIGYDNEEVKPLEQRAPQKLKDRYNKLYTSEQINFTLNTQREKYLSQYTVEDIEFVLDSLDLEFEERVLNYTYHDVYDYIKARKIGQKNYTGPPTLPLDVYTRRVVLISSWKNGTLPCNEYKC